MAAAANRVAHASPPMYEDLNEIATLRFSKELESISSQTREKVREMQSEYAALTSSSVVRSGPQEAVIGRAQIEGSERLVRALFDIWVDLVKRRSGHISRPDVDFIAKKLEGFVQTQKGHLHSAFSSQRMGAVVNLLTEEAERRLYAATANARRDLAIMAREHEVFANPVTSGKPPTSGGDQPNGGWQQRHTAELQNTLFQGHGAESEEHNASNTLASQAPKAIWAKMFSWVVTGPIVLGFIAIGFTFMPYEGLWAAADVSFVAGAALFLLRFWTWEEASKQPALTKWFLLVAVTLLSLTMLIGVLYWNHAIHRATSTSRSKQEVTARKDAPGNNNAHVDGTGAQVEPKEGEQIRPLNSTANSPHNNSPTTNGSSPTRVSGSRRQYQEVTLILRNDAATPQFYVNDQASFPISYSSGIARLRLPTGSYLVRAEYPNWTCRAYVSLPLERQRPVPANCTLR